MLLNFIDFYDKIFKENIIKVYIMETEITVQVYNSLEEIDKILTKQGFILIKKVFLQDFYFSKYSLKELQSFDYPTLIKNSCLIRNEIDLENKSYICYKNKILDNDNNVIAEKKTSCLIADFNKSLEILNKMGLTNWCNLQQDMYIYSNNKICFAVQVVKDLGIFIEYEEDDNMQDLSENEKISYMYNNLKQLKLELGNDYSCKKVYLKFKQVAL